MADYGLLQEVQNVLRSTALAAAASISDTELVVESAGDLEPDGGVLSLAGVSLDYTDIAWGVTEDDSDTITLAAPLAAGADVGDVVVPVTGGLPAEDWYAVVDMGGGDPVMVPIKYTERASWPLGMYDPAVRVQVSDDLQHIEDAPGRTVLPTTNTPALARFSGSNNLDPVALGATEGSSGSSESFVWETIELVGGGTDLAVSTVASRVEILKPGIYAVTWSLFGPAMLGTRETSSLRLTLINQYLPSTYDVILKGGMPDNSAPTACMTFYMSQEQIDDGNADLRFRAYWDDFDIDNFTDIYCDVYVQQIVSASAPTQSTPTLPEPLIAGSRTMDEPTSSVFYDSTLLVAYSDPAGPTTATQTGTLESITLDLPPGIPASPIFGAKIYVVTGSISGLDFTVTGISPALTLLGDDYPMTVACSVPINEGDYLGIIPIGFTGVASYVGITSGVSGADWRTKTFVGLPSPGDVRTFDTPGPAGTLLAFWATGS